MATDARERARRTDAAWTAGPVYAVVRTTVRFVLWPYFRVRTTGREHIPADGPVILAPVHRSNLDSFLLSPLTRRRLRALAKISLFNVRLLAWFLASLGSFPVRREGADRESMRVARDLLDEDNLLLVFPEGTRRDGPQVAELFDGTAWLAAKAGARVVPVGIAGSGEAMPSGARFPKPCRIRLVVHPALEPPEPRAPRSALRAWTADLESALQSALDEANAGI
ncbi:MAG: lysophospholipid acyltransferase family protein [Acidimicrobiales bacterium]|nr:lysophospholipid acyltransferase family protein [Acidimicrobiales bacterium]|tara:strand:- start:13173 stop:13844 length:672 start_codon:yes stop_codon:yes gene_type:complete